MRSQTKNIFKLNELKNRLMQEITSSKTVTGPPSKHISHQRFISEKISCYTCIPGRKAQTLENQSSPLAQHTEK